MIPSLLGFATGLVVSVFSRTLVLLGGVLAACYHVSALTNFLAPKLSLLTCLT